MTAPPSRSAAPGTTDVPGSHVRDQHAATARLVVLCGPSGAGKGTVVRELQQRVPELWVSVSATTRQPRAGEVDGLSYRFLTPATFAALVHDGEMLEHATYAGNSYGTPRAGVEAALLAGRPVLLEIDLQGARQVRTSTAGAPYPVTFVFLAPPDLPELERRLRARGTEDEAAVVRRLAAAKEELAAADEFDTVVVNAKIEDATDALVALVVARA